MIMVLLFTLYYIYYCTIGSVFVLGNKEILYD